MTPSFIFLERKAFLEKYGGHSPPYMTDGVRESVS